MKIKFSIIVLICLYSYCNAQNILQMQNEVISQLNKDRIPFGVLYDKVVPMAELRGFTKFIDSSISNPIHFHQAYFEFYNSIINTQNVTTPEQLANIIEVNSIDKFSHPLGILKINYSSLDTNAIKDERLKVVGDKIIDGTNPNSPYLQNKSIIVSILDNGEEWDLGIHKFKFVPELLLGNNIDSIKQFSINLNGKEWQRVNLQNRDLNSWGDILTFSYRFENEETPLNAYLEIELVSGEIFKSQFSKRARKKTLEKDIVIQGIDGGDIINLSGPLYQGIWDYGVAPQNPFGTANIFYATNRPFEHKVRNPIIFFDGYDPSNNRTPDKLYSRKMNQPVLIKGSLTKVGFADYLRSIGFDLITIDPAKQDRFIEENALLLEDCITQLWSLHHSTIINDFVVMGPSLGGVICQFALADMEHKNIPHHTRLYVSFDTPHQGANVPIGLQNKIDYLLQGNFLNTVTKNSLEKAKYNFFNNPAGRQLLAHHYLSGSQHPTMDNYRITFLNHLASVGEYPQNLRKVAIINGNIDGVSNPYTNPCDLFTKMYYQRIQPWKIWNPITELNWKTFSSTENAVSSCKNGKFWTWAPFLSIIAGLPFGNTNYYSFGNIANTTLDDCPASYLGDVLDDVPSKLETVFDLINLAVWLKLGWTKHEIFLENIKHTSFIPSTSAADIIQSTPNLNKKLSEEILMKCSGITPFDWVYSDKVSTEHVAITDNISKWTIDELLGNTSWYYPTPMSTPSVTGAYNGSNNTFKYTITYPQPPSGQSYYWNVTSTSSFTSIVTGTNLTSFIYYGPPGLHQLFKHNVLVSMASCPPGLRVFQTHTFNGGGQINSLFKKEVISESYPDKFIFPNPTYDKSTIFFTDFPSQNCFIEVYSIFGNLVKKIIPNKIEANILEISTTELSSGVYFLKICDNGKGGTLKLVKN